MPFVSKARGIPLAKIASRIMAGEKLKKFNLKNKNKNMFAVKEAVFPFNKFPNVDVLLGPEMKSTGEVMGIDKDFGLAYAKSQIASQNSLPTKGLAFISLKDRHKNEGVDLAKQLVKLGFTLCGTEGTANRIISAPFHQGKNSVYEGGVNVPLIVTGPGVERNAISEALVNSTDMFSTIMEMAGVDPEETVPEDITIDSVSFFSALSNPTGPSRREWIYADALRGSDGRSDRANYAIRGARYKLLKFRGVEEFYDLQADPYESDDLLLGDLSGEQRSAYETLKAEILRLRSSE